MRSTHRVPLNKDLNGKLVHIFFGILFMDIVMAKKKKIRKSFFFLLFALA